MGSRLKNRLEKLIKTEDAIGGTGGFAIFYPLPGEDTNEILERWYQRNPRSRNGKPFLLFIQYSNPESARKDRARNPEYYLPAPSQSEIA